MEVDQGCSLMVEMVQYTNMQEPNSSPKVIEESKGNAQYADQGNGRSNKEKSEPGKHGDQKSRGLPETS